MQALLELKGENLNAPLLETALAKGVEVACPQLSRARIVVERVRPEDRLLVLRMARQPSRVKPVPAHFLLLEFSIREGEVWVETDPVMLLPAKKGDFVRDETSIEPYEEN
jgi:hypothetical protein|nr:hypothetical protein [Neorhizobium tomejilense]